MTYTPGDGFDPGPSDEELLEIQTQALIKVWVSAFTLSQRLHGPDHQSVTDLNTIRDDFLNDNATALEAQASARVIMVDLCEELETQFDAGNWSIATKYDTTPDVALATFKTLVADSTDFADFQARVAAL